MKKILFSALFLSLFMISCDKDEDDPPAKTKTELVTQANWKFSAAMMGTTDVSSYLQPCQKDNLLKFNSGGTGTASEGALKCNSGDPDTYSLTWNFLSAETQIKILPVLYPGGSDTYTIVTLSETQLVVSQLMTLPAPFGSQTVVFTFIH